MQKAQELRNKDTTSLKAEATTIRECLLYCKDNVIQHIIIESDSWIMVQILQGNWEVPWSVTMEVNSIRALMCNISVRVIHSFREGNTLADFFTNLVFVLQVIFNLITLVKFQQQEEGY